MSTSEKILVAIALASAVIAAITLFHAILTDRRRRRLEVAMRLESYYRDARVWSDRVIEKMSEAIALSELDPGRMEDSEFFHRRQRMRAALSGLLDQGRLYLPNTDEGNVGMYKQPAYRGLRQTALDAIAESHRLVERLDYRHRIRIRARKTRWWNKSECS